MEGAHTSKTIGKKKLINENKLDLESTTPDFMIKKIQILEKEMYRYARDLEFEEAAKLRDQIEYLQKNFLGFENSDIG